MPVPIASGMRLTPSRLNRPTSYSVRSTASQTGVGTTETLSLTVPSVTFKAGWAYEVQIRGLVYGTAAAQALFRVRKTNVAGTDWGEFGRVRCESTSAGTSAMANGSIVLLRSATTDLTAAVALTIVASSGTVNVFANAASPRYVVVRPCGFASEYAGCGVEVN
ncbi:hypothetical protein [Micromonospora zamorensis]|uniref:hypothetical protein n=1 Tax=Micromonospora zamorensis TaxID=709883 RepID=UPI0012FE6465|nr:hypothetical protein [Micromonospora zamorensis]